MLQHNPELKSQIDQLWNKFWVGGISNPLTAIETNGIEAKAGVENPT